MLHVAILGQVLFQLGFNIYKLESSGRTCKLEVGIVGYNSKK